MMIRSTFVFLMILLLPEPSGAQTKKIEMLENAVKIKADLQQIARSRSEPASDHGYLANKHVVDCFAAMRYDYTGGRFVHEPIRFRLRFPEETEPGKKYPLIIWFHGAGESGQDNRRQLAHLQAGIEYLTGPRSLDFFMLAVQCPADNRSWRVSKSNDSKGDAPLTVLAEILDALIEEYPIDTDRISLFGICSGANGAWQFAMTFPERFASVVICQSMAPADQSALLALKETVIWIFHSIDDGRFPLAPVEKLAETLTDAGGKTFLTTMKNGHNSWTPAMRDHHVVFWMTLQNRKKTGPPPHVRLYHRSEEKHVRLFVLPMILIGTAAVCLGFQALNRRSNPNA